MVLIGARALLSDGFGERMTQVSHRVNRFWAFLAIFALVATGTILGQGSDAAWAKDYPSWNDVEKAKKSEASKKAQISRLQALLKQLEAEVAATEKVAQEKGQ